MTSDAVAELRRALTAVADPERAPQMAAYMKDQFPYFGISAAERRRAARPFAASLKAARADELLEVALALWAEPEREFQYVGGDLLRARVSELGPTDLGAVAGLITTKSWWDTVDSLAAHVVGPLVATYDLTATMDDWIHSDNMWLARTAILHQLTYKDATDAARLFNYVEVRAGDKEFFIRKALGWALRQYARVAPDEVRRFVEEHRDALSGLTVREATKHL